MRRRGGDDLILAVYVDDIIVASSSGSRAAWVKSKLFAQYKMTDAGALSWFLGIRITRDRAAGTIVLDQEQYIETVLRRFGMQDSRPVSTPAEPGLHLTAKMSPSSPSEHHFMADKPYRSLIGSLMFAMVCSRPDIAYALGVLCRFMSNPGPLHWKAGMRILAYLRGHTALGLTYTRAEGLRLHGYADASWADDRDNRRSTTGFVYFLSGAAVSCKSRLQPTTSLSSTEAEYKSAGAGVQEALFIRSQLSELGFPRQGRTILFEDNQGCIKVALNQITSHRLRHVDIWHHFIHQHVVDGSIELRYLSTKRMIADACLPPRSGTSRKP